VGSIPLGATTVSDVKMFSNGWRRQACFGFDWVFNLNESIGFYVV